MLSSRVPLRQLALLCRTLSTSLNGGVPIIKAFDLAAGKALDQVLTARALRSMPFVQVVFGQPTSADVADLIDDLSSPAARDAAFEFAETIGARGLHDSKRLIVEACQAQLG